MKGPHRQFGYTLIEVVVALSILAGSIAALSESYALSLKRSQRAENLTHANLLLASVRDRLGSEIPLDGQEHIGASGDCNWSTRSTLIARPKDETDVRPQGYQARIEVRCGQDSARREASVDLFLLEGGVR